MKKLAVLGSTGSIGQQTLDVAAYWPHEFIVYGLAANRNIAKLWEQIRQFRPTLVCVTDRSADCKNFGDWVNLRRGPEALVEIATHPEVDLVVVATSGTIGLSATLAALQAGKEVALANKETLVIGGELVIAAARESGVKIRPIDSEHSALWQCVAGEHYVHIRRLLLTASGGPFRTWSLRQLQRATPDQALQHPSWTMGRKITVDSATLMNKGLEVIEAHWLFGQPYDKINVLIHPQSIIHSMIEFVDGSIKAQLSVPDMRLAIQYALTYPNRLPSEFAKLDWTSISTLTFEEPDLQRFPCLSLAYEAGRLGGTYPAVLVAADELLVDLFLNGQIGFLDIPVILRDVLEAHNKVEVTLDSICEAMQWARDRAYALAKSKAN